LKKSHHIVALLELPNMAKENHLNDLFLVLGDHSLEQSLDQKFLKGILGVLGCKRAWVCYRGYWKGNNKANTFPLIILYVLGHEPAPKCYFVLGPPNGSPKIPKIGTLVTLGAHKFVCKLLIEVRYESKL